MKRLLKTLASLGGAAVLAACLGLGFAGTAQAHHSFAVFFEPEGHVSATGVVTEFNFRNPHASIAIEVTQPDGTKVEWRGETNSPSLMRRRGWSQDTLHFGQTITMEGWPARDGSRYMRIRTVRDENGELIGQQLGFEGDSK
jgi:hypothetical protein